MMCYRDKTYCDSKCKNGDCSRFISESVKVDSARVGLPLALADFSRATISEDGTVHEGCLGWVS